MSLFTEHGFLAGISVGQHALIALVGRSQYEKPIGFAVTFKVELPLSVFFSEKKQSFKISGVTRIGCVEVHSIEPYDNAEARKLKEMFNVTSLDSVIYEAKDIINRSPLLWMGVARAVNNFVDMEID